VNIIKFRAQSEWRMENGKWKLIQGELQLEDRGEHGCWVFSVDPKAMIEPNLHPPLNQRTALFPDHP
jgi:hypothetical protein